MASLPPWIAMHGGRGDDGVLLVVVDADGDDSCDESNKGGCGGICEEYHDAIGRSRGGARDRNEL